MVCLDTSFVIDFFRGKESAVQRMKEFANSSEAITISAPTIMELATGAGLADSQSERQQINTFLSSVMTLPLNAKSALLAGELNAKLILGGETIEPLNIQIGAIAVICRERLLTANPKHFSRIPGLVVEDYIAK